MISIIRNYVFLLLCLYGALAAESVSVIIPCTYKHFYLLSEVLDALASQTQIPDEVVISLSEAHLVDAAKKKALEVTQYPFEMKLITSDEVQYPGVNRNIASEHSRGEIIITQDADDLPHPQRVELICYFFKKKKAVHLMHLWIPPQDIINEMPPNKIQALPQWIDHYTNFHDIKCIAAGSSLQLRKVPYLANGSVAVLRKVLKKVKWSGNREGEDVKFNKKVIQTFNKSFIIHTPLLIYRKKLSSYSLET